MNITKLERRRLGANSLVRDTTLGITAPRPAPVRNLKAMRWFGSIARADANVSEPNMAVHTMTTRRLPTLFAKGESTRYPIMSPTIAAERMGPSAATGRPHSFAITGAAKLIDWVSKPSRNMTAPDKKRMR
ncbi:hypothetical protein ABIE00_003686 [Arthrobacter sp. OAP107]